MNKLRFLTTCALFILTGCSGVSKLIQHGSFEAQTSMSDTIFLEDMPTSAKTIWVQVKNTTGDPLLNITKDVYNQLIANGYEISSFPENASLMLQVNILKITNNQIMQEDVEKASKDKVKKNNSSISRVIGKHLHATAIGVAAGKAIGGSGVSAVCGGMISNVSNTLLNDITKIVKFTVITDIQVSQRSDNIEASESVSSKFKQGASAVKTVWWDNKTGWKTYNTRVISEAQRINLRFHQAAPILKKSLATSIAGIF